MPITIQMFSGVVPLNQTLKKNILLRAESKPIKDTLFGQVSEEAKTIAETSKITNKITKRRFTHTKGSSLFLGQGGLPTRKAGDFQGRRYNYHSRNFINFKLCRKKLESWKNFLPFLYRHFCLPDSFGKLKLVAMKCESKLVHKTCQGLGKKMVMIDISFCELKLLK